MFILDQTKINFQNSYKQNNKFITNWGVLFLLFVLFSSIQVNAATENPEANTSAPLSLELPSSPVFGQEKSRIARQLQNKFAGTSPGEFFDVIVILTLPEKAAAFQKNVGPFTVKHEFSIIHGFAASMNKAQIQALSNAPGVFHIHEDGQVSVNIDDAREDFGINHARTLGVPDLTGSGVTICVIDTGVDTGHQQTDENFSDFCNAITGGCNVDGSGNAITAGEPPSFDDHGHGTTVTSTAAGDGNPAPASSFQGVAPGANIAAAKVIDSTGVGTASVVMKGVEWCAGLNDVDILNISLGENTRTSETNALSLAVNCVVDPGWSASCAYPTRPAKVVVVSAGNSGPAQEQIFSPGEAQNAITVAASYNLSEGGNALAAFSSRGPIPSSGLIKPDVTAPGINITTAVADTTNGYAGQNGTSYSSPFVAGVVALMLEADPSLTPSEIKSIIEETAQDWGEAGKDNDWGAGQLDASAAVQRALGVPLASVTSWSFPNHIKTSGHLDPWSGPIINAPSWEYDFQVDDPDLPISVTMLIGGDWICIWDPGFILGPNCSTANGGSIGVELDMKLIKPDGSEIDFSECPGDPDTHCGGPTSWDLPLYGTQGRQETTTEFPPGGGFDTGIYTLEVYRNHDVLGNYDYTQAADFMVEIQNAGGSVNLPPETNDVVTSGLDNELIQIDLSGSDGNGTVDGFVVTTLPINGMLYLNSDGTGTVDQDVQFPAIPPNSGQRAVYFDPDVAGFQYDTDFEYAAVDNEGVQDATSATVMITVNPSPLGNVEPETNDIAVSGFDNELIQVNLSGSDSNGTVDAFVITALPINGMLYLNADGTGGVSQDIAYSTIPPNSGLRSVYFDPDVTGFQYDTDFEYAAVDNEGAQDATPATATLTVNPLPSGNSPPVAAFNWHCDRLFCSFFNDSNDPDLDTMSYIWDFGDGTTSTTTGDPTRTYKKHGTYTVTLTANDGSVSTLVSTAVEVTRKSVTSGSVTSDSSGSSGSGSGDTTPPTAPAGLIASPDDASSSLDWDDNGETDISSYTVHRSTLIGGPYTEVATGIVSSTYSDSSLSNGTTYYYVVTALDTSDNESGYSNESSATPTGGGGTPASVHVSSITVSTISAGQGQKRGQAEVVIMDDLGNQIENTSVSGTFTGDLSGSDSGLTNSSGSAVLFTSDTAKGSVNITFCVDVDVDGVVGSLPYDSGNNVENCDSN